VFHYLSALKTKEVARDLVNKSIQFRMSDHVIAIRKNSHDVGFRIRWKATDHLPKTVEAIFDFQIVLNVFFGIDKAERFLVSRLSNNLRTMSFLVS